MIISNLQRAMGITLVATLSLGATAALAVDAKPLVINDGEISISTSAPAASYLPNLEEVYSGWLFRKSETQLLQMDDFDNPGMIFVDQAIDEWNKVDGTAGKSCASCHTGGPEEFAGLRATLPKWNEEKQSLYTMEDYINESRTERMGAEAWGWDSPQMTSMNALISLQSRGMTVNVATDGPVSDIWAKGEQMYYTRVGQLDLSCANCHEQNFDTMIRADRLSQGQVNGFPTYRLKNAKLNSIQGRFKGCMKNVRATPYKVGSDEFRALELYVASRGNGLSVESPSVRN